MGKLNIGGNVGGDVAGGDMTKTPKSSSTPPWKDPKVITAVVGLITLLVSVYLGVK